MVVLVWLVDHVTPRLPRGAKSLRNHLTSRRVSICVIILGIGAREEEYSDPEIIGYLAI